MFCKETGLRRHELVAVLPEDIRYENDILYVHVKQGKGGKSRNVQVIGE